MEYVRLLHGKLNQPDPVWLVDVHNFSDTRRRIMKEDTAGRIHRERYGKSDKLNAVGNRNNEFQEGYAMGVNTLGEDARKVIEDEEQLRKEVRDDLGSGFAEWRRGFSAARSQLAAAGIRSRNRQKPPFFNPAKPDDA